MGKIIILDENTSNKIAAGEVVERPASVIKELIENSIDAGSSAISVEIRNGGISYIKVTDNGSGIDEDDVEIAFERHATSKIRSANDLGSIATLGFRGEALASIAAVSSVELTTRVQKNTHGTYIKVQGGFVKEVKPVGCPVGTTFIVRDLFYNTPARFKFLKKDSTETGYISDIISRIALARPDISFRLSNGNTAVIHTPGNNDVLSAIFSIYGKETARETAEINYSDNKVKITGYAGKPQIARATRNHQSLFVNGRYVKSKVVASAIDEAYKTFLMKNKYPFIVMNIEVNPILIDVNVHPTKMEIRFSEEQEIFRSVYHAVTNAILGNSLVKNATLQEKDKSAYRFETASDKKEDYVQQGINAGLQYVREKASEVNPASAPKTIGNVPYNPERKQAVEHKEQVIVNKSAVTGGNSSNISCGRVEQKNDPAKSAITPVEEETAQIEGSGRSAVKADNYSSKDESGIKEDRELTHPVKNNLFENARIIGQVFSTYILLQCDNEMLMIDQHAAHERIMYDRLLKSYMKKQPFSQELIAPVVIELTNQEIKIIENDEGFLESLGFNYESFGNNTIMLRSVPYMGNTENVKEIFMEVADYMINASKSGIKKDSFRSMADEALYTIACKAAIKANKKLDEIEIKNILKELEKLENPYTCPHGRPTIVKLKKYELEKMFKRIV